MLRNAYSEVANYEFSSKQGRLVGQMTPDPKRAYPEKHDLLREEFRKIRASAAFQKSVGTVRKILEKGNATGKKKT